MTSINTLSNAKLKFYQSLREKKYRKQHGLFLAEGKKLVTEGLQAGFAFESILVSEAMLKDFSDIAHNNILICKEEQINRISTQEQPEGIIGIAPMKKTESWDDRLPGVALYKISDPGNMGTILRTALWFGIKQVVCDSATVELYNPKTVRATMGALWKMNIQYTDHFAEWLQSRQTQIIGADMDGVVIEDFKGWNKDSILLFGNESNGLRGLKKDHFSLVHVSGDGQIESLNVGVASGIFFHEWFNKKAGIFKTK